MEVMLLTSIPAKRSSEDDHIGNSISNHSIKCIDSWVRSGFKPYSVNSINETNSLNLGAAIVKCVNNDASALCGKPLVYLSDMVDSIPDRWDAPVAITNADIHFEMNDNISSMIKSVSAGRGLIFHRYDYIKDPRENLGAYASGYDLLVFHPDDLKRIDLSGFVFGAPWWDHYIPIAMMILGVEITTISEPCVFHRAHSNRWNMSSWRELGKAFKRHVNKLYFSNIPHSNNTTLIEYISLINRRSTALDIIRSLITSRTMAVNFFSGKLGPDDFDLHFLSKRNIRLLDGF